MDRTSYITAAHESGWRVYTSVREGLAFTCANPSCGQALFVPDAMVDAGQVPEPCQAAHRPWQGGHEVRSYEDLVAQLTAARGRYGISQGELAAVIGLAEGHINKLEAGWRTAAWPTILPWLSALGFGLVLQPVAMPRQVLSLVRHQRRVGHRVSIIAFAKLQPRTLGKRKKRADAAAA